jgi:hypothetical protein
MAQSDFPDIRTHQSGREEPPGHGRILLVFLALLLLLEYGLYLALVPSRPSAEERWDKELPGGSFANVLGQRGWWQTFYVTLFVIVFYIAKTAIVFSRFTNRLATIVYATISAMCLPLFWVFVTRDWNNAHAELGYWFTLPGGLLPVPTVGFICDLESRPYQSVRSYVRKTCIEVVLIPVWFILWIFIEFALGFYWI